MEFKTLGIAIFTFTALLPEICMGEQKRPNVLFIMTDQQRWDAIGCAGNLEIKTPNIDRLAKEGVQFLNAYSSCPVSVPARASILTGRTIFNVKVLKNSDINNEDIPDFQTFDQILSSNGYRTEYYGKWHSPYKFTSKYDNVVKTTTLNISGVLSSAEGFRQYLDKSGIRIRQPKATELIEKMSQRPYVPLPIDENYGKKEVVDYNGIKKNKTKTKIGIDLDSDKHSNLFGIIDGPKNSSLAAYEGEEGLEALKSLKPDKPFSLTCSFVPPHNPFVVPKDYAALYNIENFSVPASISDNLVNAPYKRINNLQEMRFQDPEMIKQMKLVYYSMITQVDEWIGKMLDELDRKGIAENTLVIFVSDHGEMLGDHGMRAKAKMYEGAAHIPLIIRYPKEIAAGTKVITPVSQHDLFATILDYTGMKIPENDGRSLRPLIEGKNDPIDYAVSAWGDIKNGGPFMIRKGDWKLITFLQMPDKKQSAISALYNLKTDPLEINNLIGNNPEKGKYDKVVAELKQSLRQWMLNTHTPYLSELDSTNL